MLYAIALGSAFHLNHLAPTGEMPVSAYVVELVAIRNDREPIWGRTYPRADRV